MTSIIWQFANPTRFGKLVDQLSPSLILITGFLLIPGSIWGFFFTPDENVQGSTVKIIFLHVPSALIAINCWLVMLISSLVWLVRRHWVSILLAKAAAPVGLAMTMIAIITGALWGQPIWGTFWVWDPRLTSFFILFLHYVSYIMVWMFVSNRELAGDLTSVICIVGSIFALLSRYAVIFWNQGLHQGATLSLDKETNIANEYYIPLLLCIFGFLSLFLYLVLIRTQTEILINKSQMVEFKS